MVINSLAEKEKRVMKLLEEGKTFKEIAQEEENYGEGEIPHNTKTAGGPILLTFSFPYLRLAKSTPI